MKHNVYLFEIEDIYGDQVKLPYRTGLIWSYCLENHLIKKNYNLDGWFWYRDQKNNIDTIFKKIKNPKFIAFSSFVWNWQWNLEMAKKIKEKFPKCFILVGGWQPPTADRSDGFFKKHPYIDIISHGEGEITFKELLLELLKDNPQLENIKGCSIPNKLTSKFVNVKKDLETYKTTTRPRIDHLSLMPSPYLNGLFDSLIKDCPYQLEATIETTRGCPYSCTFCEIGTEYYRKVQVPIKEKVFREIDWLSKNKVLFVYNADSNFGMMRDHMDIVKYMIKKKKETGYPDKHRCDWSKVHNEKVVTMAKILHSADMDKGITLALQSMNPKTCKAIKRINMNNETLKTFLDKYIKNDIPSYVELILGLPEESKNTFIEGIFKVMELEQHNYIGIYPLTALPNTPLNEKKYIKKYKLKIVNTFPAFSHIDIINQNEFEKSQMVVANRKMTIQDYKDSTAWRWLVMFGHYLGYFQFIARFLRRYKKVSYKKFYSRLFRFIKNRSIFLKEEYSETYKSLNKVLNCKGPWGRVVDSVRKNFAWDFEEATAIRIIKNKTLFEEEVFNFLKGFKLDQKIMKNLLSYQLHATIDPQRTYPYSIDFDYNIHDFIYNNEKLKKIQNKIQCNGKNYKNDIELWAKETLWWGRRSAKNKTIMEIIK